MTEHFIQRNDMRREFLRGLAGTFCCLMSGLSNDVYGKKVAMNPLKMTLWQTIEALTGSLPFTKANLEMLFGTTLNEKSRNAYTVFLEGRDVHLAQGSRITKIDLRLGQEPDDPGFLVLSLDGACVTISQVRNHYENLEITGTPRGRSLDEETSYSAMLPWGKLSFGFAERKPDCLTSIVFDPKKPD